MNTSLALHRPLLMGEHFLHRSTGYRAAPEKFFRLQEEARRRSWSVQRFLDWCTDNFLELIFLDPETRAQVRRIAAELGAPYTPLDVVAGLTRAALRSLREGKVVPSFFPGQLSITRLFGSR